MRIIKIILGILAAFIALILIASLVVKKDYSCERTATIVKPKQQVFDYVKFLQNQENYSVWAKLDPNMKKGFSGTDGMAGATASWEGNDKVGKGAQEIKSIEDGKINYELRFEKPMESVAQSYMSTEAIDSTTTKVTWAMSGTSPWPWNIMNLFMDKMVGDDLQTGLNNLKTLMEKQ